MSPQTEERGSIKREQNMEHLLIYLVLIHDKLQDIRSNSWFSMLILIAWWEDIVVSVDLEDKVWWFWVILWCHGGYTSLKVSNRDCTCYHRSCMQNLKSQSCHIKYVVPYDNELRVHQNMWPSAIIETSHRSPAPGTCHYSGSPSLVYSTLLHLMTYPPYFRNTAHYRERQQKRRRRNITKCALSWERPPGRRSQKVERKLLVNSIHSEISLFHNSQFMISLAPFWVPIFVLTILSVEGSKTSDQVATAWYTGWHSTTGFPLSEGRGSKYTHLTYAFA